MTDDGNTSSLFLKPGQIVISAEPLAVTTLLGSCVSITMFSPRHRLGAICHALLPVCRKDSHCRIEDADAGKYVECAIRLMIEGMASRGAGKGDIEAKIFGGSEMFDMAEGRSRSVGRQNREMALQILEKESLRLVTQDLGGDRGRKIIFYTDTGEVFLKRLRKSEI